MDKSRAKQLERAVVNVVKRASRPGGPLEKEEFTMGIARKEVCREMGLESGSLDDGEWKGVVKKLVLKAIDEVSEEQEEQEQEEEQEGQVEEEEEEEQASEPEAEPSPSPPPTKKQKQREPSRSKAKTKSKRSVDSDEEPDSAEGSDVSGGSEASEPDSPKPSSSKPKSKRKSIADPDEEAGDKSESEMSSLYDEPPAKSKRRTFAGKEKTKRESTGKKDKKPKKADDNLTADESRVVDLKKIVVTCGVRKQWSKEFADYPKARDQIRHLESILRELGMKGQPTLGKARSLKERRELAAELDDVRQFEAARGLSSDKASRRKAKRAVESESESEEGEQSALGAIMDFLGDESD